jgi:transposase
LADQADRLRELNRQQPDLYPAEIRERLQLDVSPLTVWRMLRRLGLTFKKSRSAPPNRIAPTSRRLGLSGRPR